MTARAREQLRGYLLVGLAACCWAAGGLMAKWVFVRLGISVQPMTLAAARSFVAFPVLFAYCALTRRRVLRLRRRDVPFVVGFGIFALALLHFSYFKAIQETDVATAILLQYLAPVMVLVISVLFLRERLTWALPAAVLLAVTGCALTVGAIGGKGLTVSTAGLFWGLVSAVFMTVYIVMGKLASGRIGPWTLSTYGLATAAVFWLVLLGARGSLGDVGSLLGNPQGFLAVLSISVISTVVQFALFLTALTVVDATKASVTATLEPVVAGLGAYLLLGESLTGLQILGGALVVTDILVIQAPVFRREPLPPAA
jgi:drug/metabolite transporter (DMT)-like permease